MLTELIASGFGEKEDLNCAEKILHAANIAYDMQLDKNALRLASGFGGGMGIESTCGALAASVMVLGHLFIKERAHESGRIKELTSEFLDRYRTAMGAIDCSNLKATHRTEQEKCRPVILKAAEILDDIIKHEEMK